MKKSFLTLLTFALVVVNLVLTGIMAFNVVPEVGQVNTLIAKISEAIDLDISSGDEKFGGAPASIDSIAPYDLADNLTINLKTGPDGKDHYAVIKVTLSLNQKSDAYETYNVDTINGYEGVIRTEINNIVGSHTLEDMKNDSASVLDEIKSRLNTTFGSDLIAAVGFSSINYQ